MQRHLPFTMASTAQSSSQKKGMQVSYAIVHCSQMLLKLSTYVFPVHSFILMISIWKALFG